MCFPYDNAGAFRNQFLYLYEGTDPNSVKPIDAFMDDFDHFINKGGLGNASNKNVLAFVDELMQSSDKFKAGGTSLEVIPNPSKYIDGPVIVSELEDFIFQGQKHRFDLLFTSTDLRNRCRRPSQSVTQAHIGISITKRQKENLMTPSKHCLMAHGSSTMP